MVTVISLSSALGGTVSWQAAPDAIPCRPVKVTLPPVGPMMAAVDSSIPAGHLSDTPGPGRRVQKHGVDTTSTVGVDTTSMVGAPDSRRPAPSPVPPEPLVVVPTGRPI